MSCKMTLLYITNVDNQLVGIRNLSGAQLDYPRKHNTFQSFIFFLVQYKKDMFLC